MNSVWHIVLCAGLLAVSLGSLHARELVVTGQAVIVNGDVGRARDEAMQRALGMAAATGSARVSTLAESRNGTISDSIRIASTSCTQGANILGETIHGNELSINVAVTLDATPGCISACQPGYTNKVVVTGIPLEFPMQIEHQESLGPTIAYDTAVELARKLRNRDRLLTDYAEAVFPYASPARAPELLPHSGNKQSGVAALAKARRAQYVLSGVYRDFAIRRQWLGLSAERGMVLDIYVHDGANGTLLRQKRFTALAKGDVSLKGKPAIGSGAFYATDLGIAWGGMLDEIALWASETVACLPLIARILKIEDGHVYIDTGAEYGIKSGDMLRLHSWKEPQVTSSDGLSLGREKQLGIDLKVKLVYPGFAMIESKEIQQPGHRPMRPDDLLYLQ